MAAGIDDGCDPDVISGVWIEQVAQSRIAPAIQGLRVFPVPLRAGRCAYVLRIPAGARAPHQAFDKRFYKRANFERPMMEQYEIRELFLRNILSEQEFRRLKSDVRESVYKPLYAKLLNLKAKFEKDPHPREVYYDSSPIFMRDVGDESKWCHDFRIWHEIEVSGHWMDIPGIGDRELLDVCRSYAQLCVRHNALAEGVFGRIGEYLRERVGRFSTPSRSSPDGWEDIKNEVLSDTAHVSDSSTVVTYLRSSEKDPWAAAAGLSDDDLFRELRDELFREFGDDLRALGDVDEALTRDLQTLTALLESAMARTYPVG